MISGFGEETVVAEIDVLKYSVRICIVFWLPGFKKRTPVRKGEAFPWSPAEMLVRILKIDWLCYQN